MAKKSVSKKPKEKTPPVSLTDLPESEADFLRRLADIIVAIALEDDQRQHRLKESPQGFHLEKKGFQCMICMHAAEGKNSWFDKHGLKCMHCQQAIRKRIIPASLARDRDSFYTREEIINTFNLRIPVINQWIKNKTVTCREILNAENDRLHLQVFLLKDNPGFFPPKSKLQVGGPVPEIQPDGQEHFVFYPWYYFVDPVRHLAKYKISKYLATRAQER